MTEREILALAVDAAAYDAVVILWVTASGTQPVLLPRSFGRARHSSSDRAAGPMLRRRVDPAG